MDVLIYTTPNCQYCTMAKAYFDKHEIDYTEKDVAEDMEARHEMMQKTNQLGVPVIEIGNEIFVGFNRPEIDRALGLRR